MRLRNYAAALLLVPVTLLVVGCSRPPEHQFLNQFFRAAKARDNTTVGRMSAVMIDPRTQGTVEDFSIESVSPETRTPLTFKPLFEAEAKAAEEEKAFLKTKIEYQNANIKAIEEILKLEAAADAKLNAAQQKTKEEWDKWREGIAAHARTTFGCDGRDQALDRCCRSVADPAWSARARSAHVRGRDDQEGRDGEGVGENPGGRDVRQDAGDYHRARRRRRPRRPADYYEDYGLVRS